MCTNLDILGASHCSIHGVNLHQLITGATLSISLFCAAIVIGVFPDLAKINGRCNAKKKAGATHDCKMVHT